MNLEDLKMSIRKKFKTLDCIISFPESTDKRILEASKLLLNQNIVQKVLLNSNFEKIKTAAKKQNIDISEISDRLIFTHQLVPSSSRIENICFQHLCEQKKKQSKVIEKNKHVKGRRKQNELSLDLNLQGTSLSKYEMVVFNSEDISDSAYDAIKENKNVKATYLSRYDPNFWQGYSIMEPNAAIQAFEVVE